MANNKPINFLYKFYSVLILLGYFLLSFNTSFANSSQARQFRLQNNIVSSSDISNNTHNLFSAENKIISKRLISVDIVKDESEDNSEDYAEINHQYLIARHTILLKSSFSNYQNSLNNISNTPLFVLYCNWKTYLS